MDTSREPQRLIPALEPLYEKIVPLGWLVVRLAAGLMIIPHGWPKLMQGVEATAKQALISRSIEPAWPLAVSLITLETIGGLCVALGLFTRFWAAAIAIEMAVIVYHHLPNFGWTARGYEYPLMWGAIMLAIALRGGGPYSLDRRIGKEL